MDVFNLFTTTNYTFLQLESGSGGNKVIQETLANGIVKHRDDMVQVDNVEAETSNASVHIRPSEPFVATVGGNFVGHGIRLTKDGEGGETVDYRIIRMVEGRDFDTGNLEFYRVELKREALWLETPALPLE